MMITTDLNPNPNPNLPISYRTTDYDPHARDVLTTGNSYASVKNQLSIGANAFVAVFAMFGVGYYLGRQYTDDRTQQLIFGLIGNTLNSSESSEHKHTL